MGAAARLGYGTAPTLDGRWLLVTMRDVKKVAVVDLKTMKVVRTVDVPDGPSEVVVSDDGKTAYVACNFADQVAEIDLAGWKVAG